MISVNFKNQSRVSTEWSVSMDQHNYGQNISTMINNLIKQSRAFGGNNQVIKCNFYRSRFLIPFTNTSAGDVCMCGLVVCISTKVASFVPRLPPSLRNMNTRGKPGIFSHVSMMQSKKVQNRKVVFYAIFIQLYAVRSSLRAG